MIYNGDGIVMVLLLIYLKSVFSIAMLSYQRGIRKKMCLNFQLLTNKHVALTTTEHDVLTCSNSNSGGSTNNKAGLTIKTNNQGWDQTLYFAAFTLWLFNIAMENVPFIDGLPNLENGWIFHGELLNNQRVLSGNLANGKSERKHVFFDGIL